MKRRCKDCGREFVAGKYRQYCQKCVQRRRTATAYLPDAQAILRGRIEAHRRNGQEAIAADLERRLEEELSRGTRARVGRGLQPGPARPGD